MTVASARTYRLSTFRLGRALDSLGSVFATGSGFPSFSASGLGIVSGLLPAIGFYNFDPFNVTGPSLINEVLSLTDSILKRTASDPGQQRLQPGLLTEGGAYPGSWTLPVCDTSTWGAKWNWDYNKTDYWNLEYTNLEDLTVRQAVTHPPCMCGTSWFHSTAAL